jgi:hypothetical protein
MQFGLTVLTQESGAGIMMSHADSGAVFDYASALTPYSFNDDGDIQQ